MGHPKDFDAEIDCKKGIYDTEIIITRNGEEILRVNKHEANWLNHLLEVSLIDIEEAEREYEADQAERCVDPEDIDMPIGFDEDIFSDR